jgi:uncharacterized protein (DUF362 family)
MTPTRREFLQRSAAALTGAALAGGDAWAAPTQKSRVVIARDAALRRGASLDAGPVLKLLDRAMQAFYGVDTPVGAWSKLVRPNEVVGLKVNCLGGRGLSTHVVLVEAICERLQHAGVPAQNIVIWDRLNSDLETGGFTIAERGRGVRCLGNDSTGYGDELETFGSVGSLVSNTLTRTCDVVINLPVLKDHGITGTTAALKNMFGAIHNPNKYHPNGGDPYIADVNMLPSIRRKVRLAICDGLTAQYEGGPSFMPQWTWPANTLLVARDPVALDYTAWQIIEQKRAERGMKSLEAAKRAPRYIATAADERHRLGVNDPARIERLEV